jgi:very-short-patch-repair endonuclease
LQKPIKNIIPRRIVFGFTTLRALKSARDILELYGVPKTEQILGKRLARSGIATIAEQTVSARGKHCRVDLIVCCRGGAIAIECDNDKAHASKIQRQRDDWKDKFLSRLGWRVLRFGEKDIIERLDWCAAKVKKEIRSLGGLILE